MGKRVIPSAARDLLLARDRKSRFLAALGTTRPTADTIAPP
jgi:hypothetical protein